MKGSLMADDSDLLPCPFCGAPAKSYHCPDNTGTGWQNTDWISCDAGDEKTTPACGCSTCLWESREQAKTAWNRRAKS
jgi:hypothetical protein